MNGKRLRLEARRELSRQATIHAAQYPESERVKRATDYIKRALRVKS